MQLWRWVFDSSLSNRAEVAQVIDGKAEKKIAKKPKGRLKSADTVIECELNGCLGKAGPRVASSGKHH